VHFYKFVSGENCFKQNIVTESEESSPNTKSFAFYDKKPFSLKLADLRDMFKKTFNSACTSTVLVFPDPLSPTPTQENTKEDPDEPELAGERDIQTEYTSN